MDGPASLVRNKTITPYFEHRRYWYKLEKVPLREQLNHTSHNSCSHSHQSASLPSGETGGFSRSLHWESEALGSSPSSAMCLLGYTIYVDLGFALCEVGPEGEYIQSR